MKNYIDDLFKYLNIYEKDSSKFETEAFFQTYNGVYTVFQALRQQRDKAVEADYIFLDKLRETIVTKSDLRQITLQVLITYFESEADTDGRSNQAYTHCRGLRPIKQDVPFFEKTLVPMLFAEDSLHDNFRLNSFFLQEISRYINRFGKRVDVNLTPEKFSAMSNPMKLLELARRRLELGDDLLKDRESLEFHLQRVDAFAKLASKNKLFRQYLGEWHYLKKRTFWPKVKSWFGEFVGKLKGAFSSSKYFRLVISQRKPAYLFYSIIMILFLLAAILVPSMWNSKTDSKLKEFKERAANVEERFGG